MNPRHVRDALVVIALVVICAAAFVLDTLLMRAMTERLQMNDFGKFYYSTRAFLDGRDMYAPSPATNLRFENTPDLQYLNMNPPHFHLLVLPLSTLEPRYAVAVWMAVSVFALIVSLLLIAREIPIKWNSVRVMAAVCGVLAFAGTQAFFLTGQISMLLMLAMTLCWRDARRGRWGAAGVWLGVCSSVKPFVLIFLPYLLATRRFRAAGVALVTAASCFAIGVLVFGVQNSLSWYRALSQSGDWAWAEMNASAFGFFRRVFDTQPIAPPVLVKPQLVKLWMAAAGVIGGVTLVVAATDKSSSAVDRAFAMLLIAALLISPLGWIYYMTVVAGPVAAVVFEPRPHGRHGWLSIGIGTVAAVGLLWPHPLLGAFQPSRWATLVFTSAYFWAALAAWMWLALYRWDQA